MDEEFNGFLVFFKEINYNDEILFLCMCILKFINLLYMENFGEL